MVPEKDKEKLEAVKKIPAAKPFGSVSPLPESSRNVPPTSSINKRPMPSQSNEDKQRSQIPMFKSGGFKPFANNPEKQRRYEHYLDLRKQGKKCKLWIKFQIRRNTIYVAGHT